MTWTYAYTPRIWVPLGTALLIMGLAIFCWRRRNLPGALPFTAALVFAALWVAGSVPETAAVDVPARVFWIKFQTIWHLPAGTAITCFLLEYVWPGRWLTRRNLALLSIVPLLIALSILTSSSHQLMWRSFSIAGTQILPTLGPVGLFGITYGYSLLIVNFIAFGWLFLHSTQHRWFVVFMVIGQIGLRALYLLERSTTIQTDLPLEVLGMVFAYGMYSFALFRYHVLDPVPLAHQAVIAQMREGVVVLNPQDRIASMNPAATAILGLPHKRTPGCLIQELIPAYKAPGDYQGSEAEINLGAGANTRNYLLVDSPLQDWRGHAAGRLLLLHDVTGQKQAQAQLLEQQRSLAILREREQLARELHDELSQELSFINVQAQMIDDLLAAGNTAQAGTQLQRLAQIAREAHMDVRGQISKLSLDYLPQDGFVSVLRRFLEEFARTHGILTDLRLPSDALDLSLESTAEVQLLRITQEAITNIRKHAHASQIHVSLEKCLNELTLVIQDDGAGFHQDQPENGRRSYGLQIMAERAAEVGGSLAVKSTPGQGTQVIVKVPVKC